MWMKIITLRDSWFKKNYSNETCELIPYIVFGSMGYPIQRPIWLEVRVDRSYRSRFLAFCSSSALPLTDSSLMLRCNWSYCIRSFHRFHSTCNTSPYSLLTSPKKRGFWLMLKSIDSQTGKLGTITINDHPYDEFAWKS